MGNQTSMSFAKRSLDLPAQTTLTAISEHAILSSSDSILRIKQTELITFWIEHYDVIVTFISDSGS